ncbi:hypothetical protein B0H14DRAFT_3852799 [Mycena olivaceomarginata]|nr:hypothetical protein B0H14DRAFT_3852799 [Mycena olivaceomarginata]
MRCMCLLKAISSSTTTMTSWADDHRPPSLSSSPEHYASDRLLSSPSSPAYSFPRIHSGPSSPAFPQDDYHLSWDPPVDPKISYSLPSFRSLFPSDDEHPMTSEYDASEYSEPEPAHDDTESEDEEHDPFFSDSRVTFTVSAERGRWKSDPCPAVPSCAFPPEPHPPLHPPPTLESSSPDLQPSSPPLPDHTSPVLSPISLSASPMVGSVSPLSAMEPLSPLSLPPSSLAGDHDMDMDLESFPENDEILTPVESETGLGLFDSSPVIPQPSPASPNVAITESPASIEVIQPLTTTSSPEAKEDHVVPDSAMDVDPPAPKKKKKAGSKHMEPHEESALATAPVSSDAKTVVHKEKTSRLKKADSPVPVLPTPSVSSDTKTVVHKETASRLKKAEDKPQRTRERSVRASHHLGMKLRNRKKARIAEASGSRPSTQSRPKRVEVKTESQDGDQGCAAERKERKARPRSPSPSDSLSRSPSPSPEKPPQKPELDPELCGMLIDYPSLKSRGGEHECLELIERVLESGTVAGGGSGVFGKVQRSGKDDSDPPLESQWFYVPERDQDQERAQLISSMMPRPAKRTTTKQYKQYYYRPLEKISRWDPEDEL